MHVWVDWSGWAKLAVIIGVITGTLALMQSSAVEPFVPVTHEYLRDYVAPLVNERNKLIADAQKVVSKGVEELRIASEDQFDALQGTLNNLDESGIEQKILVLNLSVQILRGEETELVIRIRELPADIMLNRRLREVSAMISRTERTIDVLQCELDNRRGAHRECR